MNIQIPQSTIASFEPHGIPPISRFASYASMQTAIENRYKELLSEYGVSRKHTRRVRRIIMKHLQDAAFRAGAKEMVCVRVCVDGDIESIMEYHFFITIGNSLGFTVPG